MHLRPLTLVLVGALAGCSSQGGTPAPPADASRDAPRDGGRDARREASARDASEGGLDATTDATAEAARQDAAPDAPRRDARAADARHDTADARHDAADARPADAQDAATTDAPTATTLSLSLPMVPPFDPSIHDYYVRCATGTNPIDVTMTAAPGSTIGLLQPVSTVPSVAGTASLSVAEGAAIVAGVTTGSTVDTYWVRCLPADFATMQMTYYPEAGAPTPGYYLVGDMFDDDAVPGGYAIVLDAHGVPVWYRKTADLDEAVDVDSMLPGTVSFTPYINFTFADAAVGEFEVHDLAAGTTTYVDAVGAPLDLHELRLLPNGHAYVIASPILTGVDLTGLGALGTNENMIGCLIQELDPSGALIWQWDALDHFDPVKDSTYPITKPVDGKPVVNTIHCNSLDVAANGDLLVSARNMDSVFMVSRATGEVLWKMGGETYTKDGAPYLTITGDPETSFYRPHDARLLPNNMVSVFDDHTAMPGLGRAVIYAYDVAAATATMAWQFQGTQPSTAMGSFRITEDGSRVIGWGSGEPGRAFSEVDVNGHLLLDFYFTDERWTFRAIKVPTSAFAIDTLRNATGAP